MEVWAEADDRTLATAADIIQQATSKHSGPDPDGRQMRG